MTSCITMMAGHSPRARHAFTSKVGWHDNSTYTRRLMIKGNTMKDQVGIRLGQLNAHLKQPSKILKPAMQPHHANHALKNHGSRWQRKWRHDSFSCPPGTTARCNSSKTGCYPCALHTHTTSCTLHAMSTGSTKRAWADIRTWHNDTRVWRCSRTPRNLMKIRALIHIPKNHHSSSATNSDQPFLDGGNHHRAWYINDISAICKQGPPYSISPIRCKEITR